MKTLDIQTARVFQPLLAPARYKGAWGGRGSGKSHFFAEKLIEDCLAEPGESGAGMRAVCIREVQRDLAQSSKLLIESKLQAMGLGSADGFKVFTDEIRTPKDGMIIFRGMQDFTADSIKSLEGFKRMWWEEAQAATSHSLNMLRPTIRTPGSELWFSWNPRRPTDAVDMMLRGSELPTGAVVVKSNWRDNPWLTEELTQERLDCIRMQPEQYDHVWDGGYVTVLEGAYYAKYIAKAREESRIGRVAADPLMTTRLFCDIGGTGARADAFTIWAAQFVGREIRVLDYYEAVGQPLASHLIWMRSKGYTPDKGVHIWLPHDGDTHEKTIDASYASSLRKAGYTVDVVPNQGKGAAMARIEAGRRLFPRMWFSENCDPGLAALGWYHEKKDAVRGIGLGPEHDWASNGADSFGLMCVVYREPSIRKLEPLKYSNAGVV